MKHDDLKPIVQAVCFACDYGTSSMIKAEQLWNQIIPLSPNVNTKDALPALYGIIQVTLKLIEEIECSSVTNVEESLAKSKDSLDTARIVNQKK